VLETVPIMQFFKRFNNSTGGSVANYIKTKGVAGITGGIEEMTTEVLQQLYSNKTAKDIYNINQDILDGVGSSGGVGFGVGFLLNAMGANAKILRKQGKVKEADALDNQVKQYEDNLENPKVTSDKKIVAKDIVTQGAEIGTKKAVQSLDRDLANGAITPEQYQEGVIFAEKAAQVVDKIPETVTGESRVKSMELLVERNDIKQANQILLQQKQTTDEAYHAGIDQEIKANEERIKKLDSEVYNIAKKPSKEFGGKKYIVDGEEVSQAEFEALQGKPIGTKEVIRVEKPTQEQIQDDINNKRFASFTYKNEAEVPDVFKDKNIVRGENKIGLFGKNEPFIRVTVPQSVADYELAKAEVKPTEVKVTEEVKPIRQLGTGANVYFENNKYRVNDNSKGKVLLNIQGKEEGGMAIANIEFDSPKEAVEIAKELSKIYPNGIPDAVLIDKVVDNIRNRIKEEEVKPTEVKVFNAKDIKSNSNALKEDSGYRTLGYPESFATLGTNMLALKGKGLENSKVGDVINIFNKDYVIDGFVENKKNPNETKVKLIRVDKDGNLLREQDLSKKEQKEGKAKEFEEEEDVEVEEVEQVTKDDLKKAEAKFAAAEDKFKKARNKIEATQVKQAGMFGGEQKGMFAMGGTEAKSTLDPLRKAAKEAKAELDNIRNRIKVQEEAQPELVAVEGRTPQVKPLSEFKVGDKFVFATDSGGSEQTIVSIDNGIVTFKRKGSKEPSSAAEIQRLGNDLALLKSDWDKGIRPNESEFKGSRFKSKTKPTKEQINNLTKELLRVNYMGNDLTVKTQGKPGTAEYVESAEDSYREIAKRYLENDLDIVEVVDDLHGGKERLQKIINGEVPKKTYQEAVKEKLEADKKQNRQIGAEKATVTKEIYRRVNQMDAPVDAEQVALRYLADGGTVSKEAVDEAYGSVKRAELNVKRRVSLSEEVKSKDFVKGNETLDDLAHRLWEANNQKIPEDKIKDKLMAEIGNNNTRLEAAEAYLDKYNAEYKLEKEEMRMAELYKEQYLEEQAEIEKELRTPLDEQIEGEASEEHINNLINQYEAEIKGEDQQLRPASEREANKEAGKRKVAEKNETELAKDYKEVIGKAGKKAKENAKKEFVDRNFDRIVEKLKIQIKCPT